MAQKEITCVVCPRGCGITVCGEGDRVDSVAGFGCARGKAYAEAEFVCPVRILTGSVRLEGGVEPLLPVRSEKPIPREKVAEAMAQLRTVTAHVPVKMHQVILADAAGTGTAIIASAEA